MKKTTRTFLSAALVVAAGLGLYSCTLKDIFNEFITGPVAVPFQIDIIPGANNGFVSLDSAKVEFNLDQVIRDHTSGKLGIEDADRVYIEDIRLQLDDATETSNFANFTSIEVAITSDGASSVVTAGTKSDIPDVYDTDLDITVDKSVNMKEYFTNNTIYYLLYGMNRRATDKVLRGTAYVRLHVY